MAAIFFASATVRLEDVVIISHGRLDTCAVTYIGDGEWAAKWRLYHQQYAVLGVTSKLANLSQKKTRGVFHKG